MDKTYYEMNEAEKTYSRIENDLEWASCILAEGVDVSKTSLHIEREKYKGLCRETNDSIDKLLQNIRLLRMAVEEK